MHVLNMCYVPNGEVHLRPGGLCGTALEIT